METASPCVCSSEEGVSPHAMRASSSTESECARLTAVYAARDARLRGYKNDVTLSFCHSKEALTRSMKCAAASFSSSRCSSKLRPCPERLFEVLDDLSCCVSAHLCRHQEEIVDYIKVVQEHPRYTPRQNVPRLWGVRLPRYGMKLAR